MLELDSSDMYRQLCKAIEDYPAENIEIQKDDESGEVILITKNYKLQ